MTLDADDIDAIARRVLALIRDELAAAPARLLDARALSEVLGVDRSWVYAHAEELHAVRIGSGRGRLRFDLDEVRRCLGAQRPSRRRATAARRTVMDVGGELLPVDP